MRRRRHHCRKGGVVTKRSEAFWISRKPFGSYGSVGGETTENSNVKNATVRSSTGARHAKGPARPLAVRVPDVEWCAPLQDSTPHRHASQRLEVSNRAGMVGKAKVPGLPSMPNRKLSRDREEQNPRAVPRHTADCVDPAAVSPLLDGGPPKHLRHVEHRPQKVGNAAMVRLG